MNELHLYLQNLGLGISPDLKDAIQKFKRHKYKRGDYLLREAQTAKRFSFMPKGKVRHFYNLDGKEYTRWVSLENNFVVAFASFVSQKPSQENLQCIEDCELLSIGREEFFSFKEQFIEIQKLGTLSLENEMIGYEDRVCQLITIDSEKRYLDFMQKYPLHALEIPQKYIASMLGIAPRHLSRIRNKLAASKK